MAGLISAMFVIAPPRAGADSQTFTDDGTFTVPANICRVTLVATGGAGAAGFDSDFAPGGGGGVVAASLAIRPGDQLEVVIGHQGSSGDGGVGYANGGASLPGASQNAQGGGGGGATAVTRDNAIAVVAGGGGGGGGGDVSLSTLHGGGSGGTAPDGDGLDGGTVIGDAEGGHGATASGTGGAGGAGAGAGSSGVAGADAAADGSGGGGGSSALATGGGGGGGFAGGGGGGGGGVIEGSEIATSAGGGGGGGSSTAVAATGVVDATFDTSPTNGDGSVVFTWEPQADVCPGTPLTGTSGCGSVEVTTNAGILGYVTGFPLPPAPPPPAGLVLPCGLLWFVVSGLPPGGSATVTVDFGFQPSAYWKLQNATWFQVPATINGNIVIFTLTDGGFGDDDGLTDGVIVDPGGPTVVQPTFTG